MFGYLFDQKVNQWSITTLADHISHGDPVFAMAQWGDKMIMGSMGALTFYATVKGLATWAEESSKAIPVIGKPISGGIKA